MRIEAVEVVPYALAFRRPYVTARGRLERRELVLVRLRTADGPEALGEAVPLSLRGGASLARVVRALAGLERRLLRLDLSALRDPDPLPGAIDAYVNVASGRRLPAPAAAALEMALFDLAAKTAQIPLWRLLRGDRAEPVRCNATLPAAEPQAVAEAAAALAGQGFGTFKLKLGAGEDVEQVAAVREAVGPGARIRVDANGAWDPRRAIATLRAIEAHRIELAEQPAAGLRELAQVAGESSIPIAADESVASPKEAVAARERGGCTFATAKLSKVGGIGGAAGIARELPTYLSSALDGPVGIAAAAHAAQALYRDAPDPALAHGLATQLLFDGTIAARECAIEDGALRLPDGPGLGVELDPDALSAHRI